MTTGGGSAGTAADGYRVDRSAIPRPRNGDNDPRWPYDPAEPGRRPGPALPVVEQPDPTAHAAGVRSLPVPVTPTSTSAPSTTTAAPVSTDPTLTRACRCGPRTTPATTATQTPTLTSSSAEAEPPPPDLQPQPAAGLLELVNRDRVAAGCAPVTVADDLMSQAQTHSNGQAAADQMFHSASIEGYDTAGENVAQGPETEADVHTLWMDSPKHRDNILGCQFTVIGYAAADSATGVRYWTEMFAA